MKFILGFVVTVFTAAVIFTVVPVFATNGMNMIGFDPVSAAMGGSDAAFTVTEKDTVRLGYNYGQNPVPVDNLYPLFPAFVEHHAIPGHGHMFENLGVDFAWENGFESTAQNTNSDMMSNPFSLDSESSHYQNILHMSLIYKF